MLTNIILSLIVLFSGIECREYIVTVCTGVSTGFRPAIFDSFTEIRYREPYFDSHIISYSLAEPGIYEMSREDIQTRDKDYILDGKLRAIMLKLRDLPQTTVKSRDIYGLDTLVTFTVKVKEETIFEWSSSSDSTNQFAVDPEAPEITENQQYVLQEVIDQIHEISEERLLKAKGYLFRRNYPFSKSYGEKYLNIKV